MEWQRGYLTVKGETGESATKSDEETCLNVRETFDEEEFPLASISLAIVACLASDTIITLVKWVSASAP